MNTHSIFSDPTSVITDALAVNHAAGAIVPVAQGAVAVPAAPSSDSRLVILDHPDVAPFSDKLVGEWGDLSGNGSRLDGLRFGADVIDGMEAFYKKVNAEAGKMEVSTFLAVVNELADGAEKSDEVLAKIEADAEKRFKRPLIVQAITAIGSTVGAGKYVERWANKHERRRHQGVSSFIEQSFRSGGDRLNSWIETSRTKTANMCKAQIENIGRYEKEIDAGKVHEVQLAAVIDAGYRILDLAKARLASLAEDERRDQQDRINAFAQRHRALTKLYADAPGRTVRSKIGVNAAVTALTEVMTQAQTFFVELRQSAFDLTQTYQTRSLLQLSQSMQWTSATLQQRGVKVLGEVAVQAVGLSAGNAALDASTKMSVALATKQMVEALKAAEIAANKSIGESRSELVGVQGLLIELRRSEQG